MYSHNGGQKTLWSRCKIVHVKQCRGCDKHYKVCILQVMASNDNGNGGDDRDKTKMARQLQELYHGRFSEQDSKTMLCHHNWDLKATSDFTMTATDDELRAVLGENWHNVGAATKDDILRDLAGSLTIRTETRQFSCKDCNHMWWTKVPARKTVSRCNTCKKKMNALPRDKQWGWAVFECPCSNEFRGFGGMKTQSPCYECGESSFPVRIEPPQKRRGRRSANTHSCSAPNCFNRSGSGSGASTGNQCFHPKSLTQDDKEFSTPHVSTGSTVNTFLSLDEPSSSDNGYQPSLSDINELQ